MRSGEEVAEKSFVPPWSFERDYLYRNGLLLSTVDEERGRLDYYLNHLGTPAQVSTGSGVVVEGGEFLFAFGEKPPSSTTEPAIEFRFTGHERDESGVGALWDDLDYMHTRFYSPHLGRFLSPDPKVRFAATRIPQQWGRYTYPRNAPTRYVDPDGLEERTGWKAGRVTNRSSSTIFIADDLGGDVDDVAIIPLEPGESSRSFFTDTDAILLGEGTSIENRSEGALKIGAGDVVVEDGEGGELNLKVDAPYLFSRALSRAGFLSPEEAKKERWVLSTDRESAQE